MATAEKAIWFQTSTEQLDALLFEVCEELQLAPTRYTLAVERYGVVNRLLERPGSPFQFFYPRIFPQGSMALGTTSKPVEGPHDLDFVLQIDAPYWRWHPLAGLHALHEFLSSNETYRKMVSLKNRVVRLTYADEFYMDILPAYTDSASGGTCILVPDRARVSLCPSNPAAAAPRESKAGPVAAGCSRKRAAAAGRAVIEALARLGIRRSVPCADFGRSHNVGCHVLPR
jgi:hypothetical protein